MIFVTMAIERHNSGFDAFNQLPDGERLYAQVMTKCVAPFGLDADSAFGKRVLTRVAQIYKDMRANNCNPHVYRCFVEALWGLATLDKDKDKLNLRTLKMPDLSLPPETRFPEVRKIETIAIPEGTTYTFRQAHGIVAKDGKATRVSYYSVQQKGHDVIGFFLYQPPADQSILTVDSLKPYEDRTIEVSHPYNPKEQAYRKRRVAQAILSFPVYDPTQQND